MIRTLAILLLLTTITFVCGCGDYFGDKSSVNIAPVSGKLMNGETPVPNAKILMLPLVSAGSDAPARWSYAETNEEGRFTMRLTPNRYGAHTGENLVLITTAVREEVKKDKGDDGGNNDVSDTKPESSGESKDIESGSEKNKTEETQRQGEADDSLNPELKILDLIRGTGFETLPSKLVREETIPEIYNRRSQLTIKVLSGGNSSVVFQIESVAENDSDLPDEATSPEN